MQAHKVKISKGRGPQRVNRAIIRPCQDTPWYWVAEAQMLDGQTIRLGPRPLERAVQKLLQMGVDRCEIRDMNRCKQKPKVPKVESEALEASELVVH